MNAPAEPVAALDPGDTIRFFDLILPDEGQRVLALMPTPGGEFRHKFLTSNADAAHFARRADQGICQVFHACHGYGPKDGSRKGDNVVACRSFYLDLDVGPGKPYGDRVDAVTALDGFCAELLLPPALIVHSGNGIHAYWPMDADMSPGQWKNTASLLKAATARQGLKADPSRTADIASVLRPPGSTHRKGDKPRAVRVARWTEQTDHDAFRAALQAYLGMEAGASENTLGPPPAHVIRLGPVDNSDLGQSEPYPPAYADRIADQCGVMATIRRTRGVTDQPTWFHGLQLLNRCEDGQELAHEWSKGDPRYTADEVDRVLERLDGIGPTSCVKFRDYQPDICASCPHSGTIVSPIALGVVAADPIAVAPVGIVSPAGGGVEASRLSNLFNSASYKRQFELGDWLVIGEITTMNSPGAGGKTTLQVLMALSLASGVKLLDLEIYKPRPVLFLNYEETVLELRLKFGAAFKYHKIGHAACERIYLYGSDTVSDATITTVNAVTRQPTINSAWFAWLEQLVIDTGAEVVFLDPWSALMLHGMNDNGLTYAIVRALKVVAAKCRCAIVISSHTRKGGTLGADGEEATLGAVALTNGARIVLGLRRLDEATAKAIGVGYGEEGNYREVINQKANFTPVGRGKYFRLTGVPMDNAAPPYSQGDWVAVAEPYTPRIGARSLPLAAMKDAAIQIARGSGGGVEPYCQKKSVGGRWFGNDLMAAIKPHMPDLSAKALEAAAKELVAEGIAKGWLTVQAYKNAHRKTATGLAVVWAATEWAHDAPPAGAYLT